MQKLFQVTVANVSDHLAQFLSFPLKQTPHEKKNEIYKQNYKYFNVASLSVTFEILIGKKLLKKNRKKTNASFITFFDIFELLLDTHAPLKKLSCSEVKFYLKPWITPGIKI